MKNKSIYSTALASLYVQVFIGVLCLFGSFIVLEPKDEILYSLLTMETVVQIVELCFYVWLIQHVTSITYDMTYIRYFDWFITTPTMLVSLVVFMIYMTSETKINFLDVINKNYVTIFLICLFNALMLFVGLLGELKKIPLFTSFLFGMLFLCASFYTMYIKYVEGNTKNLWLLLVTFIVWSLYGVAFLLPYEKKNIMYNILDIFSKNINGLLLVAFMTYVGTLQLT